MLAPRLTIYPEYAADPDRWLDPAMRFPVLDRSDAEHLGRDDPGAHFPERVSGTRDTGDGAEVMLDRRQVHGVVLGRAGAPAGARARLARPA